MEFQQDDLGDWKVQCQKCGASSCPEGIRYTQSEAVRDWNTRAADPRLAELEARHAKAITCLKLIEDAGGMTTKEGLHCNGSWCAEQAREVLKRLKEDAK
jgi:hypothetical protein